MSKISVTCWFDLFVFAGWKALQICDIVSDPTWSWSVWTCASYLFLIEYCQLSSVPSALHMMIDVYIGLPCFKQVHEYKCVLLSRLYSRNSSPSCWGRVGRGTRSVLFRRIIWFWVPCSDNRNIFPWNETISNHKQTDENSAAISFAWVNILLIMLAPMTRVMNCFSCTDPIRMEFKMAHLMLHAN